MKLMTIFLLMILAEGSDKNYVERFEKSLNKRGKTVHPSLMSTIISRFSTRLIVITSCTSEDVLDEECYNLYFDAANLPGSLTRRTILREHNISVNGPLNPTYPNILSAVDSDGTPSVIKLLTYAELSVSCSIEARRESIDAEIKACTAITQKKLDGLVHYRLVTVHVHDTRGLTVAQGEWNGLLAPQLIYSLAVTPQLNQGLLKSGYVRIKQALEELHTATNLVHMDVKAANVFVNHSGLWFLGDHGSCRSAMSPIFTATVDLNPYKLILGKTPAHFSMDFVQLCVMIAMLLDIKEVASLRDDGAVYVNATKVENRFLEIHDTNFRDLISRDFRDNLKLVQDHLAGLEAVDRSKEGDAMPRNAED